MPHRAARIHQSWYMAQPHRSCVRIRCRGRLAVSCPAFGYELVHDADATGVLWGHKEVMASLDKRRTSGLTYKPLMSGPAIVAL